ncbi:MAG TPA: arginine--tRNA ligase, partial [Candidatus Eisenbacteria bacterium]|nr:arginine--tRNA ligase [Candidatus Eisenbacteria bacterium]
MTLPALVVERTANPAHGDYSVTLPLKLARELHRKPTEIAAELAGRLSLPAGFADVEIAPPGFINLRLRPSWLQAQVEAVAGAGAAWGRSDLGHELPVQVEFVSSNPTGPLLFSHARGAVVGDVVARLLEATGFAVQREYYV